MRTRRTGTILLMAAMALPLLGAEVMITAPAAGAAAVPGAPRSVFAIPGNFSATVGWKAPVSNGGSAITGYIVTPYLGTVAQPARAFASAKTTQVITGLTNKKAYSFKVAAKNAIGKGAASAKSGAIVSGAPGKPGPARISDPPDPKPGKIEVASAPPKSNGSVFTRFNASCISSNGGATVNGTREKPAVHIVILSGLTVGKTYKCTMTATNARGTGPKSNPSPAFVVS